MIGRKNEIKLFESVLESNSSTFIAFYGRRRVGKTFLVRNYFDDYSGVDFISFTGNKARTSRQEVSLFKKVLNKKFKYKDSISSWFDIFYAIENIIRSSSKEKKIVFLDEIPWLDKKNSEFLSEMSNFWDTFAATRNDVIFIVSGSSGSWMSKMILKDKGSLYNRVVHKVHLKPFSLKETKDYLNIVKNVRGLELNQLLHAYFCFGGIPFYLNLYDPLISFEDNIEKIFTDKFYNDEYDILIESMFSNSKVHKEIFNKLINKKGQIRELILDKQFNFKTYDKALDELIYSDFISLETTVVNRNYRAYFLIDEFIHNYYNRDFNSCRKGLRFEKVILKEMSKLKKILNEEKVEVIFDFNLENVQIDLVIIGEYNVYMLEIKCQEHGKYDVLKPYLTHLEKRESVLTDYLAQRHYRSKKIIKGFITVNGLSKGKNTRGLLDISLSDFI